VKSTHVRSFLLSESVECCLDSEMGGSAEFTEVSPVEFLVEEWAALWMSSESKKPASLPSSVKL